MDEKLKTSLTIKLFAGELLVAESSDASLWQRVLSAITSDTTAGKEFLETETTTIGGDETAKTDSVDRFARELGINRDLVVGALAPTDEAPFLHFDTVTWEAFKRNFPKRGSNAVPAIVLAMTALALWFRVAELGTATSTQGQAVLGTIHVSGPNPTRSIKNCAWLQQRSGGVVINPAENSRAVSIVRAFCSKKGPE